MLDELKRGCDVSKLLYIYSTYVLIRYLTQRVVWRRHSTQLQTTSTWTILPQASQEEAHQPALELSRSRIGSSRTRNHTKCTQPMNVTNRDPH